MARAVGAGPDGEVVAVTALVVVDVLEGLFRKSPSEAYRVMMQVHLEGRGIAGVYPWEVAETKVDSLTTLARDAGHPLQATIEDA